ncbi:HipA domain-containing protein [Dechloromonas sp. XY25]|uniref:HipA domain-containing protein n=1 Tax=Dechloromonas hankyongensis TaxID=2908002 RepID=A0ABS9K6C0_9RHOO|nr:HipA domain-containing protein [Dechloromonas hankyongensis]MCG2578718.1 HipA domain-containing protein [Dechloromonas hankyongensis]
MSRLAEAPSYQPADSLYLWWLADPAAPRLVGTLTLVKSLRGISLRYAPAWLAQGFALSEDLPLRDIEFLPERDGIVGAVDDARPDRWGERVIRYLDKPPRLSLLEYLFFAGDERFGALGVSTSDRAYQPRWHGPLPSLGDVDELHELVRRVMNGEPVPADQKRLLAPGTLGGARPKALLEIDGRQWVLKFGEGDPFDAPLVEHASMTLAARAGIAVAATRAVPLAQGHAVAVQRFDRDGGRRLHALSAHVALRAAGEKEMGYPELALLLRRRGVVEGNLYLEQMRELFRRMVFNILIDNTDDHEKNHALLVDTAGHYRLAPAFDVLPAAQALGYQQMRVGLQANDSTLDNALSEARLFGLKRDQAVAEVRRVIAAVAGWQAHFAACGVGAGDIELLATAIDRPHLRGQRDGF